MIHEIKNSGSVSIRHSDNDWLVFFFTGCLICVHRFERYSRFLFRFLIQKVGVTSNPWQTPDLWDKTVVFVIKTRVSDWKPYQ